MRILLCWSVALWVSLWGVPAAGDAVTSEASPHARDSAPGTRHGLLYQVSQESNTVYLFGSIHAGKPEFYPLDDRTTLALAQSKRVYLEVDLADEQAVRTATARMAMYPDSMTLDRAVSASLQRKVLALLERYNVPKSHAFKMKPWMLALTLLLMEAAHSGYDPALSTETYLMDYARTQHKDLRGLETIEEQLGIFDELTADQQQAFLALTVAEIEDGRAMSELALMGRAWWDADGGGFEHVLSRMRADRAPIARVLTPRLMDHRNRMMARRIEDIVRSGPPSFIAIGSLHLVGAEGVVSLLRARGLVVREL